MNKLSLFILTSTFILASCGGGGGSSTPSAPSTPAPTVNFSASSSSIATGTTATLTWSSSNATSCSASVTSGDTDFSGAKDTSGNEDVAVAYGTNTFNLSCIGSGGSTSKSVTIDGTQGFDATAFVGTGSKTYRGFLIYKENGKVANIATLEFDLSASQDDPRVIDFQSVRMYESQYLGYYFDEDDNPLGLKLGGNRLSDYDGTPIPIADNFLNGIYLNPSTTVDPYNYPDATLDDLVQFSADMNLELDMDEDYYGMPDLEMGILALPNEAPSDNSSVFIGYSEISDNSYTVLYMEEKPMWDDNQLNKPSEADILGRHIAIVDLLASYQSLPDLIPSSFGFIGTDEKHREYSHAQGDWTTATLRGSYKTHSTDTSNNGILTENIHAVKYLFNGVSESDQRLFFKMDTNANYGSSVYYIEQYEVYFLSPDKSVFVGFKLGGYDGTIEGDTNVRLLFFN